MSKPDEEYRSGKEYMLLLLWAFTPAILIASSILGGRNDNGIPDFAHNFAGHTVAIVGILGMPVILYAWSFYIINDREKRRMYVVLVSLPLTLVMCIVNLTLGFAGCVAISGVIPSEGIF